MQKESKNTKSSQAVPTSVIVPLFFKMVGPGFTFLVGSDYYACTKNTVSLHGQQCVGYCGPKRNDFYIVYM